MKYSITIVMCLFVFNTAISQVFYQVNDTLEIKIKQDADSKHINAFLEKHKATAIEFNLNQESIFPIRLKNKKGNWALFHLDYGAFFMAKKAKKYSFQFPTIQQEGSYFTWATRKNKTYWVDLENQAVETKMSFDEVSITIKKDTVQILDYYDDYREREEKIVDLIDKIIVRRANKWGLIEGSDYGTTFYLSRDFLYDSPEEVPPATGFQSSQLKMMESIRKKHNVDLLVASDENGYSFKGRNKKTKLFGLFMGEGEVINSIPAKYDDIIRHRNPETFEVWKNGKVGYYNGNYEVVFEPQFDNFDFVHLDYTYGCALKTNGKWELYDPYEPKKLVAGSAKTIDELIELWLNR